ncbi:unnamed protein product [Ixodes persulcatus]
MAQLTALPLMLFSHPSIVICSRLQLKNKMADHDELLQAHRNERKELQGRAAPQRPTAAQFEACFRRLQSVPFPANNIASLHLHEFLAGCAGRHGLAEDALLLSLATCAAHLMALSDSALHLSAAWRERPVLWSAVLVPRAHTCRNFAWTLQGLLCRLHGELSAPEPLPLVVDALASHEFPRLVKRGGPVAGMHTSLEPVRTLYSAVGSSIFSQVALGIPVLSPPPADGKIQGVTDIRYNVCCVAEPASFHAAVSPRLGDGGSFEECLWPVLLLCCCRERTVDLSTLDDAADDKLEQLLRTIANAHRRPVTYRLSADARSVLPQILAKFKRLASTWNCKIALFRAASSQVLRLAVALFVLDGCLSYAVRSETREYEIPAAHLWEAHDVVMHSLRLKAELLERPLRDDVFGSCVRSIAAHGGAQHVSISADGTNGVDLGVAQVLRLPQHDMDYDRAPVQLPREISVSLVRSPARDSRDNDGHDSLPADSLVALSSIVPESEEEFVDKFRYKIRRLLISGKALLTPTLVAQMKYVSVPDATGKPRYPTQAAALFLERVAALGFGTMLTRHDSHSKKLLFRKTEHPQLGPRQLQLLQGLRVTREQYTQGCQRHQAIPHWETGGGLRVHLAPVVPAAPAAPTPTVKQQVAGSPE